MLISFTKALFVGFAGLAGSQTASADEGTQSSQQQNESQKQAPSLNDLQKHQVLFPDCSSAPCQA